MIEDYNSENLARELARLQGLCNRDAPFSDSTIGFMSELSSNLLRRSRRSIYRADLAALSHWLRRSNLSRLKSRLSQIEQHEGGIRVSRGLAVHFAPANVETLFAYSWSLSVLSGCPSIVRISSRNGKLSEEIVQAIDEVVDKFEYQPNWLFLSYSHQDASISELLTGSADVVVVWGGDETVSEIRNLKTRPHSTIVPFGDRESLMVINAERYLELSSSERDKLVERAKRDILTFDQAACSSPKRLIWIGTDEISLASARDFESRFSSQKKQLEASDESVALAKITFAFEAVAKSEYEVTVNDAGPIRFLHVRVLPSLDSKHPGLGTVFVSDVPSLSDLGKHLFEPDQTIAQFGFTKSDWESWVRNSSGFKPRTITNVGEALTFDANWDGFNVLTEFTRLVAFKS